MLAEELGGAMSPNDPMKAEPPGPEPPGGG